MAINFDGSFSDKAVNLNLNELGKINIYLEKPQTIEPHSIFILMRNKQVVGMSLGSLNNTDDDTKFLEILVPENLKASDFFYCMTKELEVSGYKLNADYEIDISEKNLNECQNYWQTTLPVLMAFGLTLTKPVPMKKGKPRHKFSKKLAETPFTVDYQGSQATVYWVKAGQFIVKKGAKLVKNPPLTKAGIVGFAGRFGLQLRQEHEKEISDDMLIDDVTLRSVNEVGTFLYFAGTNSWLQLKDPDGKTLNELTIVK